MPQYALNTQTGEITLCRSTGQRPCPHADNDHYASKDDAQKSFESMNENNQIATLSKAKKAPEESSLPFPSWAEEHKKAVEAVGGEYSIVNRIIHQGKPMIITHSTLSSRNHDKFVQEKSGMNISETIVHDEETGEKIGFINVCFVNDESVRRCFGDEDDYMTPIRYAKRYISSIQGAKLKVNEDPRGNDKKMRELWLDVMNVDSSHIRDFKVPSGAKMSGWSWTADDVPEDPKAVEKDIESLSGQFKEQLREFKRSFSVPFVEFAEIEDEYKGTGLGKKMYVEAAKAMGKRGMVIRSSSIQSEDAERLWSSLRKDENIVVKEGNLTIKGDEYDYLYLDYRDQ